MADFCCLESNVASQTSQVVQASAKGRADFSGSVEQQMSGEMQVIGLDSSPLMTFIQEQHQQLMNRLDSLQVDHSQHHKELLATLLVEQHDIKRLINYHEISLHSLDAKDKQLHVPTQHQQVAEMQVPCKSLSDNEGLRVAAVDPSPARQERTHTLNALASVYSAGSVQQADTPQVIVEKLERAKWEMCQLDKLEREHTWFERAFHRKMQQKSVVGTILHYLGFTFCVPSECPQNRIVTICDAKYFHYLVALAVSLNVAFSAYVSDQSVHDLLQVPPKTPPDWWRTADLSFLIFFTVELAIRLSAYRVWFFVSPHDSRWNLLDLFLVVTSSITTYFDGVNFVFFRLLRMFKFIRVARVLRVVRAFSELRRLLFAVYSCMAPLMWSILFLSLTMFVFSLIIMQGIETALRGDNDELQAAMKKHFNGLRGCFKTLFSVVGGAEWGELHESLSQLGHIYAMIMPIFIVFVNIGVMNIVIGVFATAASKCSDRDLIAQDQMADVEEFVESMMAVYKELAKKNDGTISIEEFKSYFYREEVQAYLAYHELDASHAQLVYRLCDKNDSGSVDLHEFVLGLLRLKGETRGVDQKVTLHAINAISMMVQNISDDVSAILKFTPPRCSL